MSNNKSKPSTSKAPATSVTDSMLEQLSASSQIDLTPKPRRRRSSTSTRQPHTVLDPAAERIIDPDELLGIIPFDRSTIYRKVQSGDFPPPIQLSPSRIGWRLSSVLRWIAEREADPVKARTFFGRDRDKPDPPAA